MAEVLQGFRLPTASFAQTRFRTRTVLDDVPPEDEWKLTVLRMIDAYGGPERSVVIKLARGANGRVLLRTVEHLHKREFEELFGFRCGEFQVDKVIEVDEGVLCVDNEA